MINSKLLEIKVSKDGYYSGFNKVITFGAMIALILFTTWVVLKPQNANEILSVIQTDTVHIFSAWYMYITFFFVLVCLGLAILPKSGTVRLGDIDEKPEFSNFSWFSMMFGAGIGVGMMTYSTAEPIFHFANNPDVIKGLVESQSVENVRYAYKWAAFHYALTPWACYGIVGLSLGYFAYNKGLPLTIRSGLFPIFGNRLNGTFGHVVDVVAIIATISGVGVTIGFGVSQFAAGIFNISGAEWISDSNGKPTLNAQLIALIIIMLASTLSAVSGVKKRYKVAVKYKYDFFNFVVIFFCFFWRYILCI